MDTVFVEQLTIIGRHGVMSHEWSHEQQFLVDISVKCDLHKGAETDKVEDTINYAWLCKIAREVIEGESMYLVEKLAETIISRILEDTRISEVSVTIRKPSVLPSGVPGVTLTRVRG